MSLLRLDPLQSVGGGAEVSNTLDAGSDGPATAVIYTVLRPLVRRLMRRQLAKELDVLATEVAVSR